jgi:hypothetical protein
MSMRFAGRNGGVDSRERSVFRGAVRLYMPGFKNHDDRGANHLCLAERVTSVSNAG